MSEAVATAQGNEIPGEKESQARLQGWAPKEEWHGPEEKWVDAETFLSRGEDIKAVMKERNAHLSREIKEVRQLLVEQRDMAQKARLQGYQQALQDIQRRQRDAAAQADVDAYDAAEREKQVVVQQFQEASKVQPPPAEQDPVFQQWVSENKWYSDDEDLAAYAEGVAQRKLAQGLTGRPLLDEVAKAVKKFAPHKFSNPRRTEPGAVEPGAQAPAPKKSGKGFDDLPATAKGSYEKLARQFKQEGIAYTKEEYLANYVWE